jgi:FKBP-type peptidyl-prolyl cis-trans isomerase
MESIRLLIPSIMAYGYRGIPGVIPSNTPVVVDLLREN